MYCIYFSISSQSRTLPQKVQYRRACEEGPLLDPSEEESKAGLTRIGLSLPTFDCTCARPRHVYIKPLLARLTVPAQQREQNGAARPPHTPVSQARIGHHLL